MEITGEAYGYTYLISGCYWTLSCFGNEFAAGTESSPEAAVKAALTAARNEMEG